MLRRVLLAVPVIATATAIETWRRGYVAPLLYGVRLWCGGRPGPNDEADVFA